MFAFARTVDDTSHDRETHVLHTNVFLSPFWHAVAHIALGFLRQFLEKGAGGAAASRTGDDLRREGAQTCSLENFLGYDHLLRTVAAGFRSQGNADGVADSLLKQHCKRRRRGDDALAAHARLGKAEVEGMVASRRQIGIDSDQVLDVADLAGKYDLVPPQA